MTPLPTPPLFRRPNPNPHHHQTPRRQRSPSPESSDSNARPVVIRPRVHKRPCGIVASSTDANSLAGVSAAAAAATSSSAPLQETDPVRGIAHRFTRQTGVVADLQDKHMTEYIESRLASRMEANRRPRKSDTASSSISAPDEDEPNNNNNDNQAPESHPPKQPDQPTKHGKLFEVAIPQDVRQGRHHSSSRNRDPKSKPQAHPNPRNRRGSDDLKRDDFVDQFLQENKLPFPSSSSPPPPFHLVNPIINQ
ncbi:hypothetical protein CDD80_6275 [Ophiocordyceps camponoti-rufipedis]|uniref:Uncharacterized protein n=1 Tax=Ophiocordyceps camponoti-rufipedis TaxID=2004952 RepID=A0A2C5YQN9_9HYPO|nr:hypothetical protein CDD80_6275 [Ophiocordyceps camponoti-rufipedis]